MKRVLVIGGTGTMGNQLVDLLLEDRDVEVHVVSRHRGLPGYRVFYHCGNAFDSAFMSNVLAIRYDAIVDFMVYSPKAFEQYMPMLLRSTDQYISLSSCAVIGDGKNPLDEKTPRYIDVVPVPKVSGDYHFLKAQTEDILESSAFRNWTIIRPHVNFSDKRIPICTYEMDIWLYRALHGLPVAIPQDVLPCLTTLTYSRVTAWQITKLIGNKKSLGEVFIVGAEEIYTWGTVLDECIAILKDKGFVMHVKMVDSASISVRIPYMESRFRYDRCCNRSFSTRKLRSVIGNFSPDFGSLRDNLSKCIDSALPIYKSMKLDEDKAWLYAAHDRIVGCWTPMSCFTFKGAYFYVLYRVGLPAGLVRLPVRILRKIKSIVRGALRCCGLWDALSRLKSNVCYARRVFACKHRYAKVLRRIRRKPNGEKIRVLFVVCEVAKYKCQKLFEEMRDSGVFEPIIALSAWNEQSVLSDAQLDVVFDDAEKFFGALGDRCVRTVKTHPRTCSDLSEFKPDIVFYSEPWAPCGMQSSEFVSRFALTCFVPYYVPNYGDFVVESQQPLHKFLYKYFTLPFWAGYFRRKSRWWDHASEFVPSGHPALDFFSRQRGRKPVKNYIVFAPHHSIKHPKSTMPWFLSTFDWTGRPILEYAKQHPEQHWVFKPHPILRKEVVVAGMMTQEEVDAYYAEWERIGTACYDSDYQELFMESCAIVTDSGSFMTEAGATGRPVIRLISPANTLTPLPPSKKVYDTYYEVRTLPEMYDVFRMVIEEGKDPKREMRLAAVEESGISSTDASKFIVNYLRRLLRR